MTLGGRSRPRLSTLGGGLATIAVTLAAAATGCSDSRPAAVDSATESAATWPTWVIDPARLATPRRSTRASLPGFRRELNRPPERPAGAIRRWAGEPAIRPWIALNLGLVASRHTPIDPPLASRGYALVSVAMYDAAVAVDYWSHRGARRPRPSRQAAVAGAASRVLAYLFPERSEASLDRLAEHAAAAGVWAGRSRPEEAEAGLALGREVAAAVVGYGRADGSSRRWRGAPPRGRGFWGPPPGTSARPVQPLAGRWGTWVLHTGSQFRPPPPPRYASRRFLAEARELLRLRRRLTPAQKRIAKFWEGGVGTPLPPGVWNEVASAYVRRDGLGTVAAARVFALLNVAMADTGVATWDTKYRYWGPRPVNAIRELGLDRRWRPFLKTPHFPGYISAHSAYSAAASEVLGRLFPRDARAFRAKVREAGLSRLYGGIHPRSDHEMGLRLGRDVGRFVLDVFRRADREGTRKVARARA